MIQFIEPYIVSSIKTFTDYELIIIDNGSTDNTASIIKLISTNRLKYFRLESPDLSKALNFGLSQAKGEYIARMDTDDFSLPNRLSKQIEYLDAHSGIGLVSSLVNYKGDIDKNKGYVTYVDSANTVITPQ